MMVKKPNFLLVTTDQHRWDCFGFGPRKVQMPNVERLARKGVRFDACITPNPLCQPARASILTGMLPLTHGVVDNGIDLNPALAQMGFGAQLTAAGYSTSLIGKAHLSSKATYHPTGTPECQHSSVTYGDDWSGPYMGFEHVELAVMGHHSRVTPSSHISPMPFTPPHGQHYERYFHSRGEPGEARDLYMQSTDGKGMLAGQTWNSALPSEWHTTNWVTDRSVARLRDLAKEDTPFCLWVSYPDPHHPFDCPAPWSTMYDPATIDLPNHPERDLENRPWWHKELYGQEENIALDQYTDPAGKQKAPRIANPTECELRHITANYYGMIAFVDHGLGRVLDELRDLGLEENTIIVFTTDHGELLGDHGLMLKGPTLYEGLLRVGCVMTAPDALAGHVVTEPVSTVDIAATFYDYAGLDRPEGVQSQSLRPFLDPKNGASRECALNEWNVDKARYGVELTLRTVRTRRHKAIFELNSGAGELYDLEVDPDEMNNLFDDPAHKNLRDELERMMRCRPGPVLPEFPAPSGLN
jgi:arylsulfatase A-like enzyme